MRQSVQQSLQTARVQKGIFIVAALLPMVVMFLIFWVYPLLSGFFGSLTTWRAFDPSRDFIGLDNYARLLDDPLFFTSLLNTLRYVIYYLPLAIGLALLAALAINAAGRLKTVFRTLYFMPVVTSVIATALIWAYFYQPRYGLFNQILSLVDGPQLGFLRSPDLALLSIAIYAVWKDLGFNIVLFMAGLSGIDQVFYDAAQVDGATAWQRFRFITLPLLRPTMVFIIITGTISALQVFGPIYVMTGQTGADAPGGPLSSTLTASVYQWQVFFTERNLGKGAAIGNVLFLFVLMLTLFQLQFLRTRDKSA